MEGEELHLGRAGVVEGVDPEVEEELWTGDDDASHAGWYCVRQEPPVLQQGQAPVGSGFTATSRAQVLPSSRERAT